MSRGNRYNVSDENILYVLRLLAARAVGLQKQSPDDLVFSKAIYLAFISLEKEIMNEYNEPLC